MRVRVPVKPELLVWARERAGLPLESLIRRFPKYREWESGRLQPTLKQLEAFAKTTHAPIGYLLLPEPRDEPIPIPDFRTLGSAPVRHASPNLLDTVYMCQLRQDWYREHALRTHQSPLGFVGSARLSDDITAAAVTLRKTLGFDLDDRAQMSTWRGAQRTLIKNLDDIGVLVMIAGVVGTNNHHRLDPKEFRGFALADSLAPVVFVNSANTRAAQTFTLANELAHLLLGVSALSNADPRSLPSHNLEIWCNRFAAEFLVPISVLQDEFIPTSDLTLELKRLAQFFKVSTLVILRQIYDMGALIRTKFCESYDAEIARIPKSFTRKVGDFYATHTYRVGRRFARALIVSTLEGETRVSRLFLECAP